MCCSFFKKSKTYPLYPIPFEPSPLYLPLPFPFLSSPAGPLLSRGPSSLPRPKTTLPAHSGPVPLSFLPLPPTGGARSSGLPYSSSHILPGHPSPDAARVPRRPRPWPARQGGRLPYLSRDPHLPWNPIKSKPSPFTRKP